MLTPRPPSPCWCRSLDWCATTELLLLIGAGQQAFERVAGVFLGWVEWVEKNMLGWDIPGRRVEGVGR
jgi:hypothetical protein